MKAKRKIIIGGVFIAVVLVIIAIWKIMSHVNGGNPNGSGTGSVACTMEAMQCQDGSFVGRSGPKCEFAACPQSGVVGSSSAPATWKTYSNGQLGFSMKYPPDWQVMASPVAITFGHPITGKQVYSLQVYPIANPQQLAVSEFVDAFIASSVQPEIGGLKFDHRISLSLNGTPAIELYSVFEYDQDGEQIFVTNNKQALKFDFPVPDVNPNLSKPAENNAIVHQMLGTLVLDSKVGKFCGGIAAGQFPCGDGYSCKLDGNYPDAGGHCVKN